MAENENPEVPLGQTAVTPGKTTSEFKMSAATQRVLTATLATILASPLAFQFIDKMGNAATDHINNAGSDWKQYAIYGALTALCVILKAAIANNYTNKRTDAKVSPYTK